MKNWTGKSILIIGILHTLVGIFVFSDVLFMIVREGLINTVGGQPIKEVAFWFLYAGFFLMILGGIIDLMEREGLTFPFFLKWGFLLLTLLGCIIMPESGFWLLIFPATGLILAKKRKRPSKKNRNARKSG